MVRVGVGPRAVDQQIQTEETSKIGINLKPGVNLLFMAKHDHLFSIFVVSVNRHRYLIEDVKQRHDLIPLIRRRIPQQNLHGSPNSISLHLSKQPALLTFHTVQDIRNVVDVLLVFLYLRVLSCKELQAFFLLWGYVICLQFFQKRGEEAFSAEVVSDVIGLYAAGVQQKGSSFFDGLSQYPINKEEILDPLRMREHSSLILTMIEMKLYLSFPQISPKPILPSILIKPRKMGRDATMQAADHPIKDFFILAHFLIFVLEAIFSINELPDGCAIVIGK